MHAKVVSSPTRTPAVDGIDQGVNRNVRRIVGRQVNACSQSAKLFYIGLNEGYFRPFVPSNRRLFYRVFSSA